MHLTSSPIDWYTARAAGMTAYVLLSAVVLLGLTMAGKKTFSRWPRFTVEDIHRFGGLLVGSFVAIHVFTIAIDAWLPFSITSLIIPFTSRYRPLWVGMGVAGAELLLALAVTNHYRLRLPYSFWRRAHYLNFAVWSAATLHGVGSGTDRSAAWALGTYAVATAGVVSAIVWRIARTRALPRATAFAGLAALASALVVVGLGAGLLRFKPSPWNAPSFRDTLTGHVVRLNGVSRGIVSLAGEGRGLQRVLIRADLLIAPQKVLTTSFQMEYLPSGALCTGTVTKVHAFGFGAVCHLRDGARRIVVAQWQDSGTAELAGGVLTTHT